MSSEDGFLGLTTGSLPLRPPVFVDPRTSVAEAARVMRAANATACLVGSPEALQGILSERDVVRAVAEGADLSGPVERIMSRGVVTTRQDELVSEAFLAMLRHNIRRLAVTGPGGAAVGMLEERDLMAARLESPVTLAAAIARAGTPQDLAQAYAGLGTLVPRWLKQGADVTRAGALAAAVRDQLFVCAARLALAQGDPGSMSLAVLGSEGRREQFLATDQDNALILGEEAHPQAAQAFASRLMDILAAAGLPPCPHGVTAGNAAWRMSLGVWRAHVSRLARTVTPEAVLAVSLLADARHVFGEAGLCESLRGALGAAVRENPRMLRYMAREAVRFEPPLSVFRALVTEKSGPNRGGLDIKRGGVFPLTQGARVLALEYRVEAADTASRLAGAARAGVISAATSGDLIQALAFMQELRLTFQARSLAAGKNPDSMVFPDQMIRLERLRLKECFKAVASFQAMVSNKYSLRLLT